MRRHLRAGTIVVFEYLYQEDVEISRHADLEI